MQRMSVLVATVLVVAAQPATGLAQLPDVSAPSLPPVEVPEVKLPPVPSVPVPAPSVPAPVPSVPAPPPSPSPSPLPLPALPGGGSAGGGSGGAGGGGTLGDSVGDAVRSVAGIGPGSDGAGADGAGADGGAAGESAASPGARADGRGARSRAARRRGPGVLGTRHETRRALVRDLRGCLDSIAPRQAMVLILRYGIGGLDPRPGRDVARVLGLSVGEYGRVRRRALRTLVRVAHRSSCESQALSVTTFASVILAAAPGSFVDPVSVSTDMGDGDGTVAVLGESRSGGSKDSGEAPSPQKAVSLPPSAVVEDGGFPLLAATALALVLAALAWVLVVRPARAAAARRSAYKTYFSRKKP